jgi:hypothetical protein
MLFNSSKIIQKFIWLAGILFSNLIIQALPKIPKLIYLNNGLPL